MQITITIPDEMAAAMEARGVSPEAYVRGLVEEKHNQKSASEQKETLSETKRKELASAVAEIRELRKGNRLDGLAIKDLIHEGHKY